MGDRTIRAVDGIDFTIREGDCFAIVGESGSGKSTLGLSLIRLCPGKVSGEIIVDGVDLMKLSDEEIRKFRCSKISIIFQEPSSALNPVMKIGEQLMEVFTVHGYSKSEAYERSVKLLKTVGIPEAEKRMQSYPHQLSGGMKQRVIIAMAIALNPRLVIADEPTSALDVTIQAQILNLLKNLTKSYGLSTILITHDMGVAAEICNRIGIMYAGKMVEVGELESIFSNPMHPYTRALMTCIPRGLKGLLKPLPGHVPDLSNPPEGCRFHPRCPYAKDVCKKEEPKPLHLDDRLVLCHRVGEI
ncbi:MAG: ABC transporter ATP-binding protein [Nitrososphaeria archaeon]|nr:ABC transporter ATP-binding protein [Nitrososphaeria archaeon]